jgi:Protein of unknown function (DUF3750)
MRRIKTVLLLLVTLYLLPIIARATVLLFDDQIQNPQLYDVETVDMSSTGILPAATSHAEARLLIMTAPMAGRRGKFLAHSWVVLKNKDADSWSRYEVLGFASRETDGVRDGHWLGNSPVLNRYPPDGRWFGRSAVPVVDVRGSDAEALIPKIEAAIADYEAKAGRYRFWPGPNSNTFIAAVLRAVPEVAATLPPTAIGRDFRSAPFVGLTDSRTGIEASLWGVLGVKIGWVEGFEVNLFTVVAGFDLRRPELKLPGFGSVGFNGSP